MTSEFVLHHLTESSPPTTSRRLPNTLTAAGLLSTPYQRVPSLLTVSKERMEEQKERLMIGGNMGTTSLDGLVNAVESEEYE